MKLPSLNGQQVLRNLAAGRPADAHVHGMSAHGGHRQTMVALRRAFLVTSDDRLTNEGLKMLGRIPMGVA